MNLWIPHDTKGEEEQYEFSPGKRLCIHCHAYAVVDDDGWCRACAGDGPTVEEIGLRCARATLNSARTILAQKAARCDPAHEFAWWRARVAALASETGESTEEGEI